MWRKRMECMSYDDTIIKGIICNKCGNTLPPHKAKHHLDVTHPIHTCPHRQHKPIVYTRNSEKGIMSGSEEE